MEKESKMMEALSQVVEDVEFPPEQMYLYQLNNHIKSKQYLNKLIPRDEREFNWNN